MEVKKLTILAGAALFIFSMGVAHAVSLIQNQNTSPAFIVAGNDDGTGGTPGSDSTGDSNKTNTGNDGQNNATDNQAGTNNGATPVVDEGTNK